MSTKHNKRYEADPREIDLRQPLEGKYWATIIGAGFRPSKIDKTYHLMVRIEIQTELGSVHLTMIVAGWLAGVFCDVLGMDDRTLKFDPKSGKTEKNLTGEKLEVYITKEEFAGVIRERVDWLAPVITSWRRKKN